jgi:KipI family sensor histidine kinase inhibitor
MPSPRAKFVVEPLGDRALILRFLPERGERPERIDDAVADRAASLAARLRARPIAGQRDAVSAYASVVVSFGAAFTGRDRVAISRRLSCLARAPVGELGCASLGIPVEYGGPDLAFVARMHGLSERQVIDLHQKPLYRVCQIGFTPGFPYLSGLPPKLVTPRLETPRTRVAAGSVGIGGAQTGIYTVDGPGGWRLIGRTGLSLFDPERGARLAAGMRVKFLEGK